MSRRRQGEEGFQLRARPCQGDLRAVDRSLMALVALLVGIIILVAISEVCNMSNLGSNLRFTQDR